jgi:hypothetical protein
LSSAWPKQCELYLRRASKLHAFKPVIDAILRADLDVPHKQRHTVTRASTRG